MGHANGSGPPERIDPWALQRWALEQRVGSTGGKAILQTLSMLADMRSGFCFAYQEDLARWTECHDRSVRRHLTGLIEAGLIDKRHAYRADRTRLADEFLLLAPWVKEWPDGFPVGSGERDFEAASSGQSVQMALRQPTPGGTGHRLPDTNDLATTNESREARERAVEEGEPLRIRFKGKAVDEEVARRACLLVRHVAERTGSSFQCWRPGGEPHENLRRVVGALLDYPEHGFDRWARMVDEVLESPWWGEGSPSIGAFFGPRVVEDNLLNPRRGAARRETAAQRKRRERDERIAARHRAAERTEA